jgi:hypothetical protein
LPEVPDSAIFYLEKFGVFPPKAEEYLPSHESYLFPAEIVTQKFPAMLVFVAIDAEVLPVGAIRGIILGIPILVVHRQQLAVFMSKFPPALGADHPVNLQGALPVVTGWEFHRVRPSSDYLG